VIVDHRPQLDLLDLDDLLLLARLGRLLLRLIFVLAVIENFADRWDRVRRDLDEVEPGFLRQRQCGADFRDALVGAILVNELDLADADLLVDARTLLGGRLRGSDRATNGSSLLCPLRRAGAVAMRTPSRQRKRDAYRQRRRSGVFPPKSTTMRLRRDLLRCGRVCGETRRAGSSIRLCPAPAETVRWMITA
jgi:hypothetical protein